MAYPDHDAPTRPAVLSLAPGRAPIPLAHCEDAHRTWYRFAECQTKAWFADTVGPDWVIFDVGAAIGLYSILFSELAPKGHVVAFEPSDAIETARANLAACGIEGVRLERRAVGARSGRFAEALVEDWTSRRTAEGPQAFVSLDDYAAETRLARLDAIKIDTDGFDLDVLKGARGLLERFDPWVVVELDPEGLGARGLGQADAFAWLAAQGYAHGLLLDHNNFAFRRHAPAPAGIAYPPASAGLDIRVSDHAVTDIEPDAAATPAPLQCIDIDSAWIEPTADGSVAIAAETACWSHLLVYRAPPPPAHARGVATTVRIEVTDGALGVALCEAEGGPPLSPERFLWAAPGVSQEVALSAPVDAQAPALALVLRSAAPGGGPVRAVVQDVEAAWIG